MSERQVAPPTADPVVPGFFADPCLLLVGATFYLVPTTDGHSDWGATSFRLFSSPDLVQWTDLGEIFDLARDVTWESQRAWAPMLTERGGRFYLYYSANDNIGVAVAASPLGPYLDRGSPIVPAGAFSGRAIDPSVFVDDDGTAYLLWGNSVAHMAPLTDDMLSIRTDELRSWVIDSFREAPWIHKCGSTYVLSWSMNDTREPTYQVQAATSASLDGPWTDEMTLLRMDEAQGILATGHHSILHVPNSDRSHGDCSSSDAFVIAYHRFAIPDGDGFHREIAFAPLRHDAQGRPLPVVPTRAPLHLIPPAGPASTVTTTTNRK